MTVAPSDNTLNQFKTLTLDIQIPGSFENVFDPKSIAVNVILSTPAGTEMLPAFYTHNITENITAWQARFTPAVPGDYKYHVTAIFADKNYSSREFRLTVRKADPDADGFIRPGDVQQPWIFSFDSGRKFKGLGESLCWTDDYEFYFKKLKASGCNFTRIWMCPWNLPIEWDSPGLGIYNMESARRLDKILELAEQYGIYIMLCMEYHGVAQRHQGFFKENKWLENPYNSANGGPCETASEIFTNPEAIQHYKNRFRYIVARYGFSQFIHSWEFWNEVDLTAGTPEDIVNWHDEMSRYINQIDPHKHMITTSFSSADYEGMWDLDYLDFSQVHSYNSPNLASTVNALTESYTAKYNKKHIIGEFGVDFRGPSETMDADPDHIGIHNALWSGNFSPTPVSPLTWWWDNVIEPNNLYYQFHNISKFNQNLFYHSDNLQPFNPVPVFIQNSDNEERGDLIHYPSKGWSANISEVFEIDEYGTIRNQSQIPAFLFGDEKKEMRNPPVFKVNFPEAGQFKLKISNISENGFLRISLDKQTVLEAALPLGPGEGPWETSTYNEDWDIYQGTYNKVYSVDIPAGEHIIKVENTGTDWMMVEYYSFSGCRNANLADLTVQGFHHKDDTYLWIRNTAYFWKSVLEHGYPQVVKSSFMNLPDISNGEYSIEFWDTYSGTVSSMKTVNVSSNNLKLDLPPVSKDAAIKILKVN